MWHDILLAAFCAVCGLTAFGIAAWAVISGQIADQGVDGLFLLLVCLLIACTFSIIPLQAVRKGLLQRIVGRKVQRPAASQDPQASVTAPAKSREAS